MRTKRCGKLCRQLWKRVYKMIRVGYILETFSHVIGQVTFLSLLVATSQTVHLKSYAEIIQTALSMHLRFHPIL